MCGIYGIFDFENKINISDLNKLSSPMEHRGPDDEGYTIIDNCLLGMRETFNNRLGWKQSTHQ